MAGGRIAKGREGEAVHRAVGDDDELFRHRSVPGQRQSQQFLERCVKAGLECAGVPFACKVL
ncbi:MAG TPA: hypothetical protein VEO74_16990, partial [Thermoanaerobaculia bacterium]|nr:hypothetical protein [Thermoanaerobaculia bacterium]